MAASRTDGFVIGFTTMCAALLLSFCREANETLRSTAGSADSSPFQSDLAGHTTLSSDMRAAVAKHSVELEQLLQSPSIIKFVASSQTSPSLVNADAIRRVEEQWGRATPDDALVKIILDNECSKRLIAFRIENPVFAEIFITDRRGFNICETNKTSDYYQADENWWAAGYADGAGKAGFGEIEFDESARMEAIALHLPVYDSETQGVIGIAKGVLNLTRIIAEL